MKAINRYLSTKIQSFSIKATDETIHKIVKDELDRLGHDADLNHVDVSEVTDMNSLFSCAIDDLGPKYYDLNPDISKWDVSKVEYMEFMFFECENFNQDISGWDVSNVNDMDFMFNACKSFNQDISNWDVKNVKNMDNIFDDCPIKEEFKPKFRV